MPNKFNLTIVAALVLVAAHDIRTTIKHRQYVQSASEAFGLVTDANDIVTAECDTQRGQIGYLIHLLEEAGVETDEFDRIALNFRSQ